MSQTTERSSIKFDMGHVRFVFVILCSLVFLLLIALVTNISSDFTQCSQYLWPMMCSVRNKFVYVVSVYQDP
jgi:hypothetical protein